MLNIGVFALQGSFAEHVQILSCLEGINAIEVKNREQLAGISGLIIPGGESTTIGKLLREYGLIEPIVQMAKKGMPVWGTCAGMILMAKEITNEKYSYLNIMDIAVKRNAYGSHLDSFSTNVFIPEIAAHEIPLVFIRAPLVERVWGDAKVIARVNNEIVAVRQGNMLVTSFHPELTSDPSFHKYFCSLAVKKIE